MHSYLDPLVTSLVIVALTVFCLSLVLKSVKQPHIVSYIIVGFILGPYVLGFIKDEKVLANMGNLGVILLLFFVGLELSPSRLFKNWYISIVGTLLLIVVSITVVGILSFQFEWNWQQVLLLGFIISLSSTSVVFKLLQDWDEVNTKVGQDVIGILLVQDLLVLPMLIILQFLTDQKVQWSIVGLQCLGALIMAAIVVWIAVKKQITIPFLKKLSPDHETQLLFSLILCFGMAAMAGFFKLSAAMGALVGGMLVAAIRRTHWVHDTLLPLKTIFISFFFISIGMLINPHYIVKYYQLIIFLTIAILLIATFINALILRILGESWRTSLYAGSLLSQIGEFSFILISVGYQTEIVDYPTYQIVTTMIALSLLLSPIWILLCKYVIKR